MIQITSKIFSKGLTFPHFTTIQTDFELVEIIALREDGTSESTNPEALKLREQAIKSTIESYEQNRKLIAADVATLRNEIARLDAARVKEIEQLKLEAGRLGLGIIDAHLRGRAELEPEVNRLKAELECSNGDFRQLEAMKERLESDLKAASAEVERLRWVDHEDILKGRAEIARLRAEVLEAQEARDRFKRERDEAQRQVAYLTASAPVTLTPGPHTWVTHADYVKVREGRDAAYGDIQTLTTERDQLKRELGEMHSAIAEPAAREAVQRVLHGVRPDLYESPGPIGGTIRPDDVVTFGKPPCSQCWCSEENVKLHVERNKIAGRLSKCREGKRAIAANYNSLVGTFDQIKRALGNCNYSDIVPIITGLQSTIAKLHIAESGRFTDERNALASELSQAKAELQRLKTTYSMDRVHGMTLEEVRGMKYQLAANREQIDAANARAASVSADLYNTEDMNKKLLARLELIRSRLGCQFGAIEMKVYELQQVQCKLDAVTRALAG